MPHEKEPLRAEGSFAPGVKVTIRRQGEGFFGPGIAELMERIAESGSVKEACHLMGLSYSKGRYIIKRAEKAWGCPLVELHRGGSGGGAAALTPEGEALLAAFRRMEGAVKKSAGEHFQEFLRHRSFT